jgi:hypothetical protein
MRKTITLSELQKINPFQYGKVISALNRNRVKAKQKQKTAKIPTFRTETLNKIVQLINWN